MSKKQLIGSLLFFFISSQAIAFTNATSYFPANNAVLPYKLSPQRRLSLGGFFEMATTRLSRNITGGKVGLFQQYFDSESIIKMVSNPVGMAATEGAENVFPNIPGQPITDDGVRGHVQLAGKYSQINMAVTSHWSFLQLGKWGNFGLGAYVPFTSYKVDGVTYTDLTKPIFGTDSAYVMPFIAALQSNLSKYGGLQLGTSYQKQGIGDCIVNLDWAKHVDDLEHQLKSVDFYLGLGLLIPGQLTKDENQVLSSAVGTDGPFGVPIKFGFWVDGKKWVRAGLDAQLLYTLPFTKIRRLKTDPNQTELFLLNTGESRKEYGITWQAHTWLMVTDFYKGVFGQLSYQFTKHESDKLSTKDVSFDNATISSARSLQGWSGQNIVLQLGYDVAKDGTKLPFAPAASLFYKKPIAGKAIVTSDTYGAMLQISF